MNEYYRCDLQKLKEFVAADLNLINVIGDYPDIRSKLSGLLKHTTPQSRLLIVYYSHLWEPILNFASFVGWRKKKQEQNWLDDGDLTNLCQLSGWEIISKGKRLLLPVYIPIISTIINKWLAHFPIINNLCLTTWAIARPKKQPIKNYSVSIVVPARNEAGNIKKILRTLPRFGKWQELIFVEGHSIDNTWEEIQKQVKKSNFGQHKIKLYAYRQKGKGKADAVRLGFSKAKGEVLMILDADLTVAAKDLPQFYSVLSSGLGEFANGCRLVYPMEKEAMRTLNKIGNKIFGWLLSYILGQRFKDTLCGTKVLFRKDYEKIHNKRKFFGEFDPFGDFDLIFGAIKQNLKIIEVPIRYHERTYGSTNISRFSHGLLLLKMTTFAFQKLKAW